MSGWTVAWILWLVAFAAIEGAALWNKGRNDTLSEHIWSWFDIRSVKGWHWKRWLLAGFLVWLLVHMVAGF